MAELNNIPKVYRYYCIYCKHTTNRTIPIEVCPVCKVPYKKD